MTTHFLRDEKFSGVLKECLEGVQTLRGRSTDPNLMAVAYIVSGVEKVKIYQTVDIWQYECDLDNHGEFLQDVIINILPSEGIPSIRVESLGRDSQYEVVSVASPVPHEDGVYKFDIPAIPLLLLSRPRLVVEVPSVASRRLECDLGLVYLPMDLHQKIRDVVTQKRYS